MLFNLIKFGFDVAKHAEEERERKIIEAAKTLEVTISDFEEKLQKSGHTLADLDALKDGVYEIKVED